jgi:hypothetical protein
MRPLSRVFALAPDCHAAGNRYAGLWQRHFYDGLGGALPGLVLPVDVDFGWARPASRAKEGPSAERSTMSERLWEQIRQARVDAVISYCFASDIEPTLVKAVVATGVPWINFFCDSTYAFDHVETLACEVSLNWFPESAAEGRYHRLGRPWLCRPYALNPAALAEAVCDTASHGVGFVGARTGNRVLRLAALSLLGCPVAVRGEGWRRGRGFGRSAPATPLPSNPKDRRAYDPLGERIAARVLEPLIAAGGPLSEPEMTRFLSECRVVLGLNEGRDIRGTYRSYLKMRDVQFPGYGSCYLTQHNRDVERAFDVGREVLTFRSMLEAVDLLKRSARDAASARAIGRAARRRVLAEHTWRSRLAEIERAL